MRCPHRVVEDFLNQLAGRKIRKSLKGGPMSLSPDQIDSANLPRAAIGGYKAGPTADLLHRVSWDYREVMHQHAMVVEEAKLLRVRVAELEQELQSANQAVNERRDPDEVTRVVLSAAQ